MNCRENAFGNDNNLTSHCSSTPIATKKECKVSIIAGCIILNKLYMHVIEICKYMSRTRKGNLAIAIKGQVGLNPRGIGSINACNMIYV